MIISQTNTQQMAKAYLFITYKDMHSDGRSKCSPSWMGMGDRSRGKYMSFHLELIK